MGQWQGRGSEQKWIMLWAHLFSSQDHPFLESLRLSGLEGHDDISILFEL